jgi:hypothetical protein
MTASKVQPNTKRLCSLFKRVRYCTFVFIAKVNYAAIALAFNGLAAYAISSDVSYSHAYMSY